VQENESTRRRGLAVCGRDALESDALAVLLRKASASAPGVDISVVTPDELRDPGNVFAVVVMSSGSLPARKIPRTIQQLNAQGSRVVFYSTTQELESARSALLAGAHLVIDIETPDELIVNAIMSAFVRLDSAQTSRVNRWAMALDDARDGLTSREYQIIERIAADPDLTISDIAGSLDISPHTIRTHIANVRKKVGAQSVHNRAALLTALRDRHWI